MEQFQEKIASALNSGHITEEAAARLTSFAEDCQKALDGDSMAISKHASAVTGKNLKDIAMLGLLATAASPMVMRAGRMMADPFIEDYRYRKMRALPGKPILTGSALDRTKMYDEWHIPKEIGGRDLPLNVRDEMLIRKAFSLTHQFAPHLTKVPELAHSHVQRNLESSAGQGPLNVFEDASAKDETARKLRDFQAKMDAQRGKEVQSIMSALSAVGDHEFGEPLPDTFDIEAARNAAREAYMKDIAKRQGEQMAAQELSGQLPLI